MRIRNSVAVLAALGVLFVDAAAGAAGVVHIDATTRNHSTSAETVLVAEGGAAKLPILISGKAGKDTKARAKELLGAVAAQAQA